ILVGLNIEIMFMFSIAGIIFSKFLLPDKRKKILGIPNRWAMAIGFSLFCLIVEIFLNLGGYLVWVYPWWHWTSGIGLVPIFFLGYFHFFVGAFYVYDKPELKDKIKIVGIIYAIGIVALCIFIPLGMI
ncbi:MAG: hypothetical protein ACFE8E_14265, partial [Candidatus Hodarchaeota archaeon]